VQYEAGSNAYSISILNSARWSRGPLEDHCRNRRSPGDCEDPRAPSLACSRTAVAPK
jgi:hypothetical protein